MSGSFPEAAARMAVFRWCEDLQLRFGGAIPRAELETGVPFHAATGGVVRVIGPQGIFKPKDFGLPLSITTSPNSPYQDSFAADGYLLYKYRGTDPNHPDNVGLRRAAGPGRLPRQQHRSRSGSSRRRVVRPRRGGRRRGPRRLPRLPPSPRESSARRPGSGWPRRRRRGEQG